MSEMLLETRALGAGYGPVTVLRDIAVQIPKGQITALIGANGAGKTTLLRAISGLCATSGDILFDGSPITRLATNRIAARGIAHVPDGRGTLAGLSVEDNLLVGGYLQRRRAARAAGIERIYSHFPKLKQRRHQQAGTLSGGEQQMLAIGRALMQGPRLLMLDEPSFGLAPLIVRELFTIIADINRTEGLSILLVEQNVHQALSMSQRAILIEHGQVARSGPSAEFLGNDDIRRAYLGS
ncbi:ABC transporter ATP-binding protein [Pararhodobacter zhoushanensis]|uniref:ABC transporter ATP-binding protein n=1 Tax=Pararhodobacter zhoushanensis TaxID=2479545 RepID=UPI000F8DDF44|nr:ABC transporter ATP-binding protein [Pararhodobacter zhoushanensis]